MAGFEGFSIEIGRRFTPILPTNGFQGIAVENSSKLTFIEAVVGFKGLSIETIITGKPRVTIRRRRQ